MEIDISGLFMDMKLRNTLILFVIAAALFTFVYVFEIRKPEDANGKSKNLGKRLLLEREEIDKIELAYADPDYERIVCSIDNSGSWQIEQPLRANADQKIMDRLVSGALGKSIHETLKDPVALSEYGLDNARVSATFFLKDGVSRTLLLGNTVPTGNYVYIKEKSIPDISLVPASIVDDLTKFVSDLRDRTVIAFDKASVQRIRLEYDDGRSIVCESKEYGWEIVEPIIAKADASAVEKIISEVDDLRVDRFIAEESDDLSAYGLAQPRIKLTASSKDGKDKILLVGSEENGSVYVKAASDKAVFLVKDEIVDKLTKQPSDLRDKTILAFDIGDVEKLELKYPQRSVILEKKSDVDEEIWELVAPVPVKADGSKVDEILRKLRELKAGEFVSDEPEDIAVYGLTGPQIQVVLSLKGDGAKTLLMGKEVKGSVYVKTSSAETVYLVDVGIMDDLTKSSLDLRDSQMMEFDRNDVKRIELKRKDEAIVLIKQEHDWRIIEPIREKAKNYEVIDILRKLDSLKAEKLVAEKAVQLSEYGLDQPDIEVTVTLKDDSAKTLLVGKKLPDSDSSHAKVADVDVIFVIEKDVVDKLKKDLSKIKE